MNRTKTINQSERNEYRRRFTQLGAAVALTLIGLVPSVLAQNQDITGVIVLTQVGCQFLESENELDHGFTPENAEDCKAVNEKTDPERLAKAKTLHLAPGRYVFRVSNKNVPYDLGFWLRGAGLIGRATLPSVSGGGLSIGGTRDYSIDLEPGDYVYSCPLNPTPDYRLVVSK